MPDLSFITHPEALLVASLFLFALFQLAKRKVALVEALLDTPRKKQLTIAVVAAVAVVVATWNTATPRDAVGYAITTFLLGLGWHGLKGSSAKVVLLVIPLSLSQVSCTPSAKQTQALAANSVAVAANGVIPQLVDAYDHEGRVQIVLSDTREEAEVRLAAVRKRWAPIWDALALFAEAHGAWATAIEEGTVTPAVASQVRDAYCALRRAAAESVELPDYPLVPCGGM